MSSLTAEQVADILHEAFQRLTRGCYNFAVQVGGVRLRCIEAKTKKERTRR